jgi:hypothetical protein
MPEQREVTEKYWTWCSKWHIPYPCRKTRVVTKWCYQFSFIVVSNRGFWTNNWGCEFNLRYEWRDWHIFPVGFDDSTVYFVEKCFKNRIDSSGPCSSGVAVDYLKKTFGSDLSSLLGEGSSDKETTE